jgi:DNA-binding NtrC family response regulator
MLLLAMEASALARVLLEQGSRNYNSPPTGALPMQLPNRERVHFLVVDKDDAIARLVSAYLKEKGHTCDTLAESFLTSAWLEMHDCEVAVVDLNMPQVDGISLISYLREIRPGLPVVVFTGVGYDDQKMHEALRAGANGYVSKNLPIDQLYGVLEHVLVSCRQKARHEQPTRPWSALARSA